MNLSVFDLVLLIGRQWKLVAACVFAAVTAGVVTALLMKPVYRSEVVVTRSSDSLGLGGGNAGSLEGLAALAGLPLGNGQDATESMGVLRSKAILAELITREDLLPILFAKVYDPVAKGWKPGAKQPTLGDGIRMFEMNIRDVREDLKTRLVVVRVDWTDRELAARWATALVDLANEEMRNRAIEESAAAIPLLKGEFDKADTVELRTSLSRLIEAQLKARTLASVRREYAFRIIDPARVSDPDKRVRPKRTLIVIAFGVFGACMAVLILLVRRSFRSAIAASTS
jgi:uncharacterized protein involved in exopolysaccharide biosynthesis